MNFRNRLKILTTAIFAGLLLLASVNAQTGTSSVSGTVNDSQGNAVTGATVTLSNTEKAFTRTAATSDKGYYTFPSIPPGTYRLEVEASNFKKAVIAAVEAAVDTPKTADVALEVGLVSESVTITGGTDAPINTTDATIGNAFTSQQVIQLPLSGRETINLLSLQPGVTPGGEVNGGRSDQANVTLDGVDVNEQQGGAALFSVLRTTPDSLQEFRVTTSNANADQGRSSGAQISLVTKGGSNDFHGSGYFYYRPSKKFQANNFFNNQNGIGQPSQERRNYGGSFLGPIIKNKLFFSAFYEKFDENTEKTVPNIVVPLASLGQGIVRYYTADGSSGVGCPAGTPSGVACLNATQINNYYIAANGVTPGINPIAVSALAAAAAKYKSNAPGGDGLNTGGFAFNAKTPLRHNTYTTRFDYKLSATQDIFARLQAQSDHDTVGLPALPDTPGLQLWSHPSGIAVGHTWTIGSHAVNRFTYGLTRDAFTRGGDSTDNRITFRYVFQPSNFVRTLSRVTPVQNFVDDFTYVKGNHAIQFGGNVRLISNRRTTFGSSYDTAIMNPSYYGASGAVVIFAGEEADGDSIFPNVNGDSETNLSYALTSLIGRYTQFGANLQYGADGKLLPAGSGVKRNFKTQEYEAYVQDSWRVFNNLTVNYGIRYSTSTPVYESNGLEVKPTTSLSDFFDQRVTAANNGQAYNGLLTVDLAGKANGKTGYYKQDWNNFAPSISAAWQPNFKKGFLHTLFGENKSTIRGGFRMTYDRVGSALAVAFDLNSTLGFSSAKQTSANAYNVSTSLGPLFTGFGQAVRTIPAVSGFPTTLKFPLQTPADGDARIEQSLDDKLTTPYNYSINLSYGRELFKGITFEASYVARFARNLLVSRDTATFNNLRDPVSGDTFYTAMRKLIAYREANTAIAAIPNIPWFNKFVSPLAGSYNVNGSPVNLTATQAAYRRIARSCSNGAPRDNDGVCTNGSFSIGGRNTYDFTYLQQNFWNFDQQFVHPQYATFAAYSTIGESNYNSAQLSVRKRFTNGLQFDFNYTYSHSLDSASGTEASGQISSGASLILNPFDLRENYASSDFDVRHLINANFIYQLPFGKGKMFLNSSNKLVNGILGGWTLTSIYRWNTGFPIGDPFDDARWATNWNVQSNAVNIGGIQSSPTKNGPDGYPNIFGDPTKAYTSYRNAYPGETGDRNLLRAPGYVTADMGLYKTFKVTEKSGLTFRLEVFNVTNTQRLTSIDDRSVGVEPFLHPEDKPTNFGRLTQIQGDPRIVQFALRYDF